MSKHVYFCLISGSACPKVIPLHGIVVVVVIYLYHAQSDLLRDYRSCIRNLSLNRKLLE